MKLKYFLTACLLTATIACNNDQDSTSKQDSANTFTDTLPVNGPGDSLPVDSNPPDATKIDSGNRTTN